MSRRGGFALGDDAAKLLRAALVPARYGRSARPLHRHPTKFAHVASNFCADRDAPAPASLGTLAARSGRRVIKEPGTQRVGWRRTPGSACPLAPRAPMRRAASR